MSAKAEAGPNFNQRIESLVDELQTAHKTLLIEHLARISQEQTLLEGSHSPGDNGQLLSTVHITEEPSTKRIKTRNSWNKLSFIVDYDIKSAFSGSMVHLGVLSICLFLIMVASWWGYGNDGSFRIIKFWKTFGKCGTLFGMQNSSLKYSLNGPSHGGLGIEGLSSSLILHNSNDYGSQELGLLGWPVSGEWCGTFALVGTMPKIYSRSRWNRRHGKYHLCFCVVHTIYIIGHGEVIMHYSNHLRVHVHKRTLLIKLWMAGDGFRSGVKITADISMLQRKQLSKTQAILRSILMYIKVQNYT